MCVCFKGEMVFVWVKRLLCVCVWRNGCVGGERLICVCECVYRDGSVCGGSNRGCVEGETGEHVEGAGMGRDTGVVKEKCMCMCV